MHGSDLFQFEKLDLMIVKEKRLMLMLMAMIELMMLEVVVIWMVMQLALDGLQNHDARVVVVDSNDIDAVTTRFVGEVDYVDGIVEVETGIVVDVVVVVEVDVDGEDDRI